METRTTQKNSNTEKQSRQTNTRCSSATLLGNWSSKNYLTAWTPLGIRRHKHLCIFIFKCINGLIDFDCKLATNNNIHSHNTRTSKNLHLPKANTNWGKQKPTYQVLNNFNNLDNTIKNRFSTQIQDFSKETNCKKAALKETNCIVL